MEKVDTYYFDRHGGVSQPPYDSLNVSFHVGDDDELVRKNRELIKQKTGCQFLLSARQVHGDVIFHLDSTIDDDLEVDGVDALITRQKNVGLLIQQADCQAVLLHDPVTEAIAAIHCGWRGSVVEIIGKTVKMMGNKYSTNPQDLKAWLSPSLGPCCAEFVNYQTELPEKFIPFKTGEANFNFWQITRQQLLDSGLSDKSISIAGMCTACSDKFFSYRRARWNGEQKTGRNCSVILLR